VIRVDGRAIDAQGSVLDVCARAGARVPALCHDGRVAAAGHCRACIVEVDGRHLAACATPARDGMVISTNTPSLLEYRRDILELQASEARLAGRALELACELGATGQRYSSANRQPREDASHPYLRIDLASCILCRLCMRACAEVQGQFVFAVKGRGSGSSLTWGEGPFTESACVSCGACASACPTGAVTDVDRLLAGSTKEVASVRTTCAYCGVGCQLDVQASTDDVLLVEGAPAAVNRGHLCVKGRYAHAFARHPERLTQPLVRRGASLEPATWEDAIARVAEGFRRLAPRVALLSSSRCTNEENYLAQKWARGALGTNNVDCCARVCHAPSAAGMRRSFGTGAATNSLTDIERADLLFVCGANITEAHPVIGARVKQAVLRGARLVVVDPRRTELAELADVHLQLRPGTNVPLLNALACVLVEENLIDRDFVADRAGGWTEYERFVRAWTPERTAGITDVEPENVRRASRLYAAAERPMQLHGLGITEHHQGSEAVQLLCNLALLCGAVGRVGVGVNPLRGQNNVQGAADMGCQPDLLTGYQSVADATVRARFASIWGRELPHQPGLTIPRMYEAMRRGDVRGLFVLGEDVVQTDPDANAVVRALESLELLVVQEIFLSETAKLAHVVLPGASFLEKDGTFTNGERRIQRVRKALEPPGEARADWRVLLDLFAACGWPQAHVSPAEIMVEIASTAPMLAGISYGRLEGEGLQWPVPDPQHPGTTVLHEHTFDSGRAPLACVDYQPSPGLSERSAELLLVTGRVLEHYNSGSMTRRSPNLVLCSADRLSIHPDDARSRDIQAGDMVRLTSAWGEARALAELTDEVRPGTLFLTFHFPETGTNRLTSDVVDRSSDCPEYKLTPVRISREP
jgi:formate dehydrogenase alpha subunit